MRLLLKIYGLNGFAKVYRSFDTGEFVVRFYDVKGKYHSRADSFHADKEDAINTANWQINYTGLAS